MERSDDHEHDRDNNITHALGALSISKKRKVRSYDYSTSSDSSDEEHETSSDVSSTKRTKSSQSSSSDSENSWSDYSSEKHCSFRQIYRCLPMSQIKKENSEDGNKIIMPSSALERLAYMDIEYPMMFEIKNPNFERVSYCGVLEFIADEGCVFLPNWMMKNLDLQEGENVILENTGLPKGTYMKIQPHLTKFITLPNPKEVLEKALKDFSCVTAGETIIIPYDNQQYYIDILETKPHNAISVVDTDCEVEFAPPLDYKEPEKKPEAVIKPCCENMAEEKAKFQAFTGVARRLDGTLIPPVSNSLVDDPISANAGPNLAPNPEIWQQKRNGKVVFGHDNGNHRPSKSSTPISEKNAEDKVSKVEEKKFQPFTGKSYTLAG